MSSRGRVIFVGNLPGDIREREVEDLFSKYGRVRHIDLKTPPRPPAFAFIEFDDPRDADDAVYGRDGYDFYGNRLRVEISRGARGMGGGGGGGGPPPPPAGGFRGRGTGHRCIVKGLPQSASWQDLKDHFRKIVKPAYTNVYRDRGGVVGVVEFDTRDDLKRAIKKLDDTEFRNPFDRGYIRIRDDSDDRRSQSRSASRSRSRSRSAVSRSRSRSPRSRSRSRSASPARDASKSRSRSKSASPAPRDKSASRSPAPRSRSPMDD